MGNTFLPFGHQPESVLQKTGADAAYVIPAGYYARVVISAAEFNCSASVNGSTVFSSKQTVSSTQTITNGAPGTSSPPVGFFGTVITSVAPATANPGFGTTQNWVASGRTWSHPNGSDSFTIYYNGYKEGFGTGELWLTSGDSFDMSGDAIYAHIELYPVPS